LLSNRESLTTNKPGCLTACAQKAISRGVSPSFNTSEARNHCCRSSSSVTSPSEVPHNEAASRVNSSQSCSGCESRSSLTHIAHSRAFSLSARLKFINHRGEVSLEYPHEGR